MTRRRADAGVNMSAPAFQEMPQTPSTSPRHFTQLGARVEESGVSYRIWAPQAKTVEVNIYDPADFQPEKVLPGQLPKPARRIILSERERSHFHGVDALGAAGDLYAYRLNHGDSYPDPAARFQPHGVHGPSMVVDARHFPWNDMDWVRPELRDLVIYELHIGTFTQVGTFLSAIERLPHVRDLGATAVEIMPIAAFAGDRNWGYDGVCLYAPAECYGTPDDFRAFVDAAHSLGLAVILDVVYNHFGPDGNYLAAFIGDYLDEACKTPWGGAIRYGCPHFRPLRELVATNPIYWMNDFHVDGFRLDATHAIIDESSPHLLQEITSGIHALDGFAIAEDPRNKSDLLLPEEEGGTGFDGVWADDFHHSTRVANTGENESYLGDFTGSLNDVLETLRHGWLYCGQYSQVQKKNRGSMAGHIPPHKFIHCISNHDQIGNHAFGERIGHLISPEAYRACSALLLLSPYSPLLFMGQEWNASAPFQFFTDHNEELGRLITEGRRDEFKDFKAFNDPEFLKRIPDPQSETTFRHSQLDWNETRLEAHAQTLSLYRACLALRGAEMAFRPQDRELYVVLEIAPGLGSIRLTGSEAEWLVLFDLVGGSGGMVLEGSISPSLGDNWSLILSSNEERFGGSGGGTKQLTSELHFPVAECAVYQAAC